MNMHKRSGNEYMATQHHRHSSLLWAGLTVRFVRSLCIDWAPFGKKLLSVVRNNGVVVQEVLFYMSIEMQLGLW